MSTETMTQTNTLAIVPAALKATGEIVAAAVSTQQIDINDIGDLIRTTYMGIVASLEAPHQAAKAAEPATPVPAIAVKNSITPDAIISLIDGKPYKLLRRHLTTQGYTPQRYRATFGLPHDYPMTAPNYSKLRAEFARTIGLGRKPAKPAKAAKTTKPTLVKISRRKAA